MAILGGINPFIPLYPLGYALAATTKTTKLDVVQHIPLVSDLYFFFFLVI